MAIAFNPARVSVVAVKVYSRAGRLVREVVSGEVLGPGASLVCWDGRDREGEIVQDGLYLVVVDALGETRKRTLAIAPTVWTTGPASPRL